jgi:DNA mismatch repair ATPase MutL
MAENDLAEVQEFIKSQVDTYFKQQVEATPALRQVQQQQVVQQEDAAQKQLGEMISPFIEPKLNRATLDSADSLDYVKFYTGNPEAVEYQEQVEKVFEMLKEKGRPLPRADILAHTIGKEVAADPTKFTEKMIEKRQKQIERAESAMDLGNFSSTRAKNDSTYGEGKFDKLTVAEMEKALDGIAF